jgi:hypothetical protein
MECWFRILFGLNNLNSTQNNVSSKAQDMTGATMSHSHYGRRCGRNSPF